MKALQHPRLLSDFVWRQTRKYRAVLTRDCTVDLRKGLRGSHEFYDGNNFRFAILCDDRLTMSMGLASDLCSPAVRIGPWWLGTPSGDREALASYVHDTARSILAAGCVEGLTRKMTDDLFYDFLIEARSRWSRIFHGAVAGPLGDIYTMLDERPSVRCSCHTQASGGTVLKDAGECPMGFRPAAGPLCHET